MIRTKRGTLNENNLFMPKFIALTPTLPKQAERDQLKRNLRKRRVIRYRKRNAKSKTCYNGPILQSVEETPENSPDLLRHLQSSSNNPSVHQSNNSHILEAGILREKLIDHQRTLTKPTKSLSKKKCDFKVPISNKKNAPSSYVKPENSVLKIYCSDSSITDSATTINTKVPTNAKPKSRHLHIVEETPEKRVDNDGSSLTRCYSFLKTSKAPRKRRNCIYQKSSLDISEFIPATTSTPAECSPQTAKRHSSKCKPSADVATQTTAMEKSSTESTTDQSYQLFVSFRQDNQESLQIVAHQIRKSYGKKHSWKSKSDIMFDELLEKMHQEAKEIQNHKLYIERVADDKFWYGD